MASCGLVRIALHRSIPCCGISSRGVNGIRTSAPKKSHWDYRAKKIHLSCRSAAAVEELDAKQSGQVAVFVDILLEWNQVLMVQLGCLCCALSMFGLFGSF